MKQTLEYPWREYPFLTYKTFEMIKQSLREEFKESDYVSKAWLIERLCQCVIYVDCIEGLRKKIKAGFKRRCRDFNIKCPKCQAWLALDLIEDIVGVDKENGE